MSLLDSACRIGHRKYLLNELIMRPTNTHTTHLRRQSLVDVRGGRIRGSVDPRTRTRRIPPRRSYVRILECRVLHGIPRIRGSRSIPGCSDFPKPRIPETSNSRISGTLGSLGPWIRTIREIENPWVLTFKNNRNGSFDPRILRSLYTSSRIYESTLFIYEKMRSRNLVPLYPFLKKKKRKRDTNPRN